MPPLPEFSSKKPLASKERFLLQTVNDFSVVLPKLSCFTHLTEPEASNQPWLSSSRCMTSVHSIWLQEMPSSVYRRCSMVNLTPSIRQMLILSFKNWNDENPGISRREKKTERKAWPKTTGKEKLKDWMLPKDHMRIEMLLQLLVGKVDAKLPCAKTWHASHRQSLIICLTAVIWFLQGTQMNSSRKLRNHKCPICQSSSWHPEWNTNMSRQ